MEGCRCLELCLPNLTHIDWLIVLFYLAFVLGVGLLLKFSTKTSSEFFQAGRSLPAWICGLAMVSLSVGAPEFIGMGAWGARFGLQAAQFFGIGSIPAMLFAGLYLMPRYYGSGASTIPGYVGMRFDEKTRRVSAWLFLLMMIFSAGIGLYALDRAAESLQILDRTFIQLGWSHQAIFPVVISLAALLVALYVLLGGLTASIYNQVLQFFVLVAGLLPVVLIGLKGVGGWEGLKTKLPGAHLHEWSGLLHVHGNSMGVGFVGLAIGLGFVLSLGFWGTDFLVLQTAMAADSAESGQRAPIIAALPRLFLPFLLILPGMIAIALPTPHTTTNISVGPDGSIVHNIQVVSAAAEHGKGLVPARSNPNTGEPITNASGEAILDADQATPQLMAHFLPTGALGLALTALLAALMSGLAAHFTAFSAVFTRDVYAQVCKGASDEHLVKVGRIAVLVAALLAIGSAYAALHFGDMLIELELIFSVVNAPMLAILLLGMSWKRTTSTGAFTGLLVGAAAALLHHGLTLATGGQAGLHGGWLSVLHQYPSEIEQNLCGGIAAFVFALIIAMAVSVATASNPEIEPARIVPVSGAGPVQWWKRAETWALLVLLAMIVLNLCFA